MKILAIEYDSARRPFTVWTESAEYRFEQRHGAFYYNAGGGVYRRELTISGPCEYWAAPEINVTRYGSDEITRLHEPVDAVQEDGFPIVTIDDLAHHLDAWEKNGSVYCRVCDDYMPDDEECRHMFWADNWGDLAGPGVCDSTTDYTAYKDSLFSLVEALGCPPEALIADLERDKTVDVTFVNAMVHQDIHLTIGGRSYNREVRQALTERRDEVYEGFGWLCCLFKGMDEDVQRTISWLRELKE